ncbi:hypothetical protein Htur_3107 [Haloterrigena turkmenica DSM 5511]|uniref:Uncharacterized protein n=1 Tax=Haloterrigena turkmenica (strain ATCC 51198 / DSM 5511 / JCM 9101 / NCIMB 13204 / VKM B-1734 / 4k) TaxID=543526 RepID=D2RZ04_HALTV|nr:hypothetical protein Htur_3107 [Haloterrigena turkmenica DSM 5511]
MEPVSRQSGVLRSGNAVISAIEGKYPRVGSKDGYRTSASPSVIDDESPFDGAATEWLE